VTPHVVDVNECGGAVIWTQGFVRKIAMDLEQAMYELGFETSELAATPSRAFSLAMNSKPDIALVDVCLEGGRER
jgi:hypothetical protein